MTFADDLADVARALAASGVRATVEPRNVVAPGAWVTLYDLTDEHLCDGPLTTRAAVWLIAPDSGTSSASYVLADLLGKAREAVTIEEPVTPDTVTLPTGGQLPALRIITTV